jgi:putative drug exporter of the RND superfamily
MRALARWCTSHRKYVLLIWIVLILGASMLARVVGSSYSNNFALPGSGAQRAADLLQQSFAKQAGDHDQIVFRTSTASVRSAAVRARIGRMLAHVARMQYVSEVVSPYTSGTAGEAISAHQRIAFATVVFDRTANLLPKSAVERVISTAEAARRPGLQVELSGQAISQAEDRDFSVATGIGLMAGIVVLLVTFGSLIAMGLPIVTALFGLGTGIALIPLFTHVIEMPDFSSELAAMIGLGVGIDYALFIVTRFREAYVTPGPTHGDVRESVVQAMNTAGRAVLFAGITVVIALMGMLLLGVSLLDGAAIASAIGVLMVMLASVTLLPALMTAAGERLARSGWRLKHHGGDQPQASGARGIPAERLDAGGVLRKVDAAGQGAWMRWSAFLERRPLWLAAIATVAILLVAAPTLAMRLGSSDASTDPASSTTHRAYELLARGFGQGFGGPLLVVAQAAPSHVLVRQAAPGTASAPGLARLTAALASAPDVASLTPPRLNRAGTVATISVYPRSSPQAYATSQLVTSLRTKVIPPIAAINAMSVYVGGATAGTIDFATTVDHKLPLFIGVVVLVSALLLLLVFRSLVIPLQAAIMNLLSIGASLGVVVVIFQWGWLDRIAGISSGPVESFIPVMLFAIVFGLSMDYEVFLISRIHEQWRRTGSSGAAVSQGLALTGRVITAAAAIMVCVFLSFFLGEERIIEEFGLSLATAVFVDAVVVRCLLLPAVLNLLGERTWRIPQWLERLLPHIDVDGLGAAPALAMRARASRDTDARRGQLAGAPLGLARARSAPAPQHDLVL